MTGLTQPEIEQFREDGFLVVDGHFTQPDIQLQHSKLAAQPAAASKGGFGWHQDFAFFPRTNTDLVAVMVMLNDATSTTGR